MMIALIPALFTLVPRVQKIRSSHVKVWVPRAGVTSMKRSVFTSRLLAGLQVCLLLMVATSLVAATGCSWFKRKKPVQTAMGTETTEEATTAPPTAAGPADNAPEGPRPGELRPFPELQVIYFDYDQSNIRQDQLSRVENNLKYLQDHPNDKVLIEGHCDERGTVEYNFSLGERRASAIRDYYLKGGIPAERLAIISKGEEEPVDPGHTEAAWAKNRRCEFKRMF
jgi:peptidoglycan-associated lipoprotein